MTLGELMGVYWDMFGRFCADLERSSIVLEKVFRGQQPYEKPTTKLIETH